MSIRFWRIFNILQGSLWFVPSLIVVLLGLLAFLMVWLDHTIDAEWASNLPLVLAAGPEGTREMLSTIAGSMLTVASVAFSFMIVVFSFASSQYASRTLHNFMDDNTNQVVLGTMLGSFVYCLLVLRTVRLEEEQGSVPVLAATVALLLAFIDLGLFMLLIHHIAEAIQAYHIIYRVGLTTSRAIDSLFPEHAKHHELEEETESMIAERAMREVRSEKSGYVQMVDMRYTMSLTTRYDLLILMQKGVGHYVVEGEVLALVGPVERVDNGVLKQVRHAFVLGPHRTIFQDPQYGILQLSDISIKALSPAINDPNTALMSLNEISRVLRQLAGRELPRHVICDDKGRPRLIAEGPSFEKMVAQALDQTRRYGMADAGIAAKMLDVIGEVAEQTDIEEQREVLRRHLRATMEDADRLIVDRRDRAIVNSKIGPAARALRMAEEDTPHLTAEMLAGRM
jgi:uncharacterized membrane protein